MRFIQMSVSGASLIIVAAIIRALGANRLSKRTFLLMWEIILLRLITPFSIRIPLGSTSIFARDIPMERPAAKLLTEIQLGFVVLEKRMTTSAGTADGGSESVFVVIWMAGVMILGLFFFFSYVRQYRKFRVSLPVDNDFTQSWLQTHRCAFAVSVRQNKYIDAPLSYGVFRPVILMPVGTDWSDLKTLRYVFTHEYVHIRRLDVVTKLILTAALCVHWFNPLVWVMYFLANRDIELSCDEAVIRKFGIQVKLDYVLTLLDMEERRSIFSPFTNYFCKNLMEERIEAIMKIKNRSIIATVLALAVFAASVTAFAATAEPSVERETSTISLDAAFEEGHLFFANEVAVAADELTTISLEDACAEGVHFSDGTADELNELAAVNPGEPGVMPLASGELAAESGVLFDTLSIGAGKYLTISINYTPTTGSMRIGYMNTSTGNISYSTVYDGSGTKPFYIGATGTYQLYVYNPSSYDVDFSLSYIVS